MALYLYISTCAGQSHIRLFSDCGIGHMIIWSLQSITFAHPLRLNHNYVNRDKDKVPFDHRSSCKLNALLPVSNAENAGFNNRKTTICRTLVRLKSLKGFLVVSYDHNTKLVHISAKAKMKKCEISHNAKTYFFPKSYKDVYLSRLCSVLWLAPAS